MKRMHHMDYEQKQPSDDAVQRYREFMFNPDNQHNCSECPERDSNSRDCGLPCGQQYCWVTAHCFHIDDNW